MNNMRDYEKMQCKLWDYEKHEGLWTNMQFKLWDYEQHQGLWTKMRCTLWDYERHEGLWTKRQCIMNNMGIMDLQWHQTTTTFKYINKNTL